MRECHRGFVTAFRHSSASQRKGPAAFIRRGASVSRPTRTDRRRTVLFKPPVHPWSIRRRSDARPRSIQELQALGRHLAALLVGGQLELDLLTFAQITDPCTFQRADMDKCVLAAVG